MNRYITRKSIASYIVFITTALSSIWLFGANEQPETNYGCLSLMEMKLSQPAANVNPAPVAPREEPQQLIDTFSNEDISCNGYEMRHLQRTSVTRPSVVLKSLTPRS